jgi:hypothetical protein
MAETPSILPALSTVNEAAQSAINIKIQRHCCEYCKNS